jgi:GT2 family glycosyltransferase
MNSELRTLMNNPGIKDLTITCINMNGIKYTRPLLESIEKFTEGITFEVIIVDNNSSDNSVEVLKGDFPEIQLIESKVTQGFAINQNMAIRYAKGRYIAILNNDMLLFDNVFQKMVTFLDEYPDVGVVGPRLINPNGSFQIGPRGRLTPWNWGFHELKLDLLFPRSRIFGEFFMTYWDPNQSCHMETGMGACMVLRREVIDDVGMLEEHIFFGTEDLEWSIRIRKAGWGIYYLADAILLHYGSGSSRSHYDEIMPRIYKGFYWLFYCHNGWFSANLFRFFVILGIGLRLPYWLLTYFLKRSRRDLARQEIQGRWKVLCLSLSLNLKKIVMTGT